MPTKSDTSLIYRKILVPIDGSGPSLAALEEAIKITFDRTHIVRLVYVVDMPHWDGSFAPESVGDILLASRRESGEKILHEAMRIMAERRIPSDCVLLESRGERVAKVITNYAKEWLADLIVMGTHGRKGVSRLILGSDAAEVVRCGPTPVLLVRGSREGRAAGPASQA